MVTDKVVTQRVHDQRCEGIIVKGLGLKLRQRLRGRVTIHEEVGQLAVGKISSTKEVIPSTARMKLEVL